MDKNQTTGLLLMGVLLLLYFVFFQPDPLPVPEQDKTEQDAQVSASTPIDTIVSSSEDIKIKDSTEVRKEVINTIENELIALTLTNQGGEIVSVTLKKYFDYLGDPLAMLDKDRTLMNVELLNGQHISLADLNFVPHISTQNDTTLLEYVYESNGRKITRSYRVVPNSYVISSNLKSEGLGEISGTFVWKQKVKRAEKNLENERLNCNVRYLINEDDYDELKEQSSELEEAELATAKWVAFNQKFFTSSIIAKKSFSKTKVTSTVDAIDSTSVKILSSSMEIPPSDLKEGFKYSFFFGPNEYKVLKDIAPDFSKNIDLGYPPLSLINKYFIIPIFYFLSDIFSNYGMVILILVLIIRIIIAPLTYKSHISQAKMRVLKPELDAIKEKNGGNMQKSQQDQMKLYRQVGINPLSGCIPALLQMPILVSLFFFIPDAIEIRQQAFLWATDLSTYDSVLNLSFSIPFYGNHVSLFTLLMTGSTLLYTWSNSQVTTMQGPMKSMQYIMPFILLFVFNSYSSGLCYYYFVSNMLSFGQTMLFRKFVDEEKIRKVLDGNRLKNQDKKKSKFQQRLEDAMKASQERQSKKRKK